MYAGEFYARAAVWLAAALQPAPLSRTNLEGDYDRFMSHTLKSVCLLLLASCALAVTPAASLARSGDFFIQLTPGLPVPLVSGGGDLGMPFDVATAPSGDIFVADYRGKVWRFNSDGEYITSWPVPGGNVVGIAADANSVYATSTPGLASYAPSTVYAYSHIGALKWSHAGIVDGLRLATTGTELLVTHLRTGGITRLDPDTGLSVGDDFVPNVNVQAISVLPDGSIYYVRYNQFDGGLWRGAVIGSNGAATGVDVALPPNGLLFPTTATDSNGQIYYAVRGQIGGQVQLFSPQLVENGSPFAYPDTRNPAEPYDDGALGMAVSPDNSTVYIGMPNRRGVQALQLLNPLLTIDSAAVQSGASKWSSENEVRLTADATVRTGAIARIDWDLDGNGSFELVDAPASVTTTFTAGLHKIRARATSTLGGSTITEILHRAFATPSAGDIGVSINNGDEFTNSPNVKVRMVWPLGAMSARIANDGGFAGAESFDVARDLPWTIRSSGSERLPRTIYVRFGATEQMPGGVAIDPTKTFQDDIILDQTDPSVISAAITGSSTVRTAATKRSYRVRLKASDRTSGVALAQLAITKTRRLSAVRFRTGLSATSTSRPRWVRVRDHAGNWSHWRAIR